MMCQGHGMIVHAGDDDTTREVTAAIPSPDPPVVSEVREQQAGEAIAEPQRTPREAHRFAGRIEKVSDSENTRQADPGAGAEQRIQWMLSRRGAIEAAEVARSRNKQTGHDKDTHNRDTPHNE